MRRLIIFETHFDHRHFHIRELEAEEGPDYTSFRTERLLCGISHDYGWDSSRDPMEIIQEQKASVHGLGFCWLCFPNHEREFKKIPFVKRAKMTKTMKLEERVSRTESVVENMYSRINTLEPSGYPDD